MAAKIQNQLVEKKGASEDKQASKELASRHKQGKLTGHCLKSALGAYKVVNV